MKLVLPIGMLKDGTKITTPTGNSVSHVFTQFVIKGAKDLKEGDCVIKASPGTKIVTNGSSCARCVPENQLVAIEGTPQELIDFLQEIVDEEEST